MLPPMQSGARGANDETAALFDVHASLPKLAAEVRASEVPSSAEGGLLTVDGASNRVRSAARTGPMGGHSLLPRAGGALDPPARLMDAFLIMDAAEAESRPLK